MTPRQSISLERQVQQNHVDIQRLWKAIPVFPEPYVGMPMAAQPDGLTTDTTATTSTTTITTRTLPPPDPCRWAKFDVTVFWGPTNVCEDLPHCPTATTHPVGEGYRTVVASPCPNPVTGGAMYIRAGATHYLCLVTCLITGPYCGQPGSNGGQVKYEAIGQVAVGESFVLSRVQSVDLGCFSCFPTVVLATRTA